MSGVRHHTVSPPEADQRLDKWFRTAHPELGFGQLQKLLRSGQVRVNARRVKAGYRLRAGEEIRIPPIKASEPRPDGGQSRPPKQTPKPMPDAWISAIRQAVIFMDEDVLAINKPAGLAVQGGSGTDVHVDGLLDALKLDGAERPRLVHRLDKDTSGVLLLARTGKTAAALTRAFKHQTTRKLYWALVAGVPKMKSGEIDMPLSKQPGRGGEKMTGDLKFGLEARTLFRIEANCGCKTAWLALSPITGRTHQLRVHCAEAGFPILGDGKYGGRTAFRDGLSNTMHLHARAIDFPHPETGHRVVIEAPLPAHMAASFETLGFAAAAQSRFLSPEIHRRKPRLPKGDTV